MIQLRSVHEDRRAQERSPPPPMQAPPIQPSSGSTQIMPPSGITAGPSSAPRPQVLHGLLVSTMQNATPKRPLVMVAGVPSWVRSTSNQSPFCWLPMVISTPSAPPRTASTSGYSSVPASRISTSKLNWAPAGPPMAYT